MKKKSFLTSILSLTIFYLGELCSQTDTLPPLPVRNLIYPTVYAKASKDPNGYTYRYGLSNEANALQDIYSFMIDVKASVMGVSSPINWEQRNLNYDTIQVSSWSSEDSIADIRPNTTVVGFEIRSPGLPMVGRYWVAAWEVIPEEEGQYDPATAGIFATHLCRTTIGPADPPSPFVPLAFLDTLITYKHQAVTLGWIVDRKEDKDEEDEEKGDGVVAKLDKRLSKAQSAIIKGDSVKARDELKKFVKKVEDLFKETEEHEKEQRKEKVTFTSEAYALLKYNAEYLIDRLPKQKGGKDNDDKEHH